jgi:predicted enzyme related to lactoylglutathione lyase
VDYPAADVDAAKQFYAAVVGFDYTEGVAEFGGYFRCLQGGRNAAGMMPKLQPDMPSAWTTYFATDDADATAAAITAAGGTVIAGPHDVGTLGRMIVAIDSQGATFGAWQAQDHLGAEIYNEPGSLTWNEAAMADADAARAFYTKVFGFSYEEVPDAGGYTTFSTGGDPLGGIGGHSPGTPQGWQTCFAVSSTDAAVAAVEAHGGKVVSPPADTPFGRFAVVEDPWGAPFELMQLPD